MPRLSEEDESFLDDAYARIIDLLEEGQKPDPAALAEGRPHLLPRLRHLLRMARAVSPLQEARPPVLPGYEVLTRLGAGGMGAVFLCRQSKMGNRLVAVKILSEAFASSRTRLDMFRDEAMSLARLRHPGVVDVYEFIVGLDENDNTVQAFAMQWIEGCSLAQWKARLDPARAGEAPEAEDALTPSPSMGDSSPVEFACWVLASVARTVHAVHLEGLLHRDLKPSNILLRRDGSALVSDFGLARDLRPDPAAPHPAPGFSGTRAFASPEQLRGEPLDARSDVYSLGVTLRQALPGPPEGDLAAIIAKATAPAPHQRYDTAADLAADLENSLSLRPVRAAPPGPVRRGAMFLRRNRRAAQGASVGAVAAMLAAAAVIMIAWIAPRRAEAHLALARLALMSPGHANVIWNIEWYRKRSDRFALDTGARERALAAYGAALRWRPWGAWADGVRRERRVVEGGEADADDLRLTGLARYMAGDSTAAIEAWSRFAAQQDPDPFIDGALGVLFLVREQHALAYPRLEHARSGFPRVGFLAAYHADAAVGCGDLDRAERLLHEAEAFDNQDNHSALTRVRGDLLLARGALDDAHDSIIRATLAPRTIDDLCPAADGPLAAFDLLTQEAIRSPIAAVRIARIRAARGDHDGAASALGPVVAQGQGLPSARAEFTGHVERWWAGLDGDGRRRALRACLDLGPQDARSLAFRLRHAALPMAGPLRGGAGGLVARIFEDFVALRRPDSHTSLERAPLVEIARRIEALDMDLWTTLPAYTTELKRWQHGVWRGAMPRSGSWLLARLHRFQHSSRPAPTTSPLKER